MGLTRSDWARAIAIALFAAAILLAMGRVPICTCGTVKLWHGVVHSAENSQHIADWYSFSHVIHGFLFLAAARALLPERSPGLWLALATLVEAAWEVAENTPMVIDRYREVTMAFGYSGDSVLNSVADIAMMWLGLLVALKWSWKRWLPVAIAFELFTLWAIRDNLTLNVLMLVSPVEAIREWQAGA